MLNGRKTSPFIRYIQESLLLDYNYLILFIFILSHGVVSLFSIYEFDCPSQVSFFPLL